MPSLKPSAVRTTMSRDDQLLAEAQRESARRLAALGGSQPDLEPTPRRRSALWWLIPGWSSSSNLQPHSRQNWQCCRFRGRMKWF